LPIEEAVWQLLPLSISSRHSKIGNSSLSMLIANGEGGAAISSPANRQSPIENRQYLDAR
jgi:hypothetical protein